MIVRSRKDGFALVGQYEHAQVSGEFARHFAGEPRPRDSTLYAINEHDLAWKELDREVRWDPEKEKPYNFTEYPLLSRIEAYRRGIDQIEASDSYAACLCSLHYHSLVRDAVPEATEFREEEESRQQRLKEQMSGEELDNLDYNFRLLQLCDDFSLFVCMNEPGLNEVSWYQNGLKFGEKVFTPAWDDPQTLRFEPNPFSESFDVTIPYVLVGRSGEHRGTGHQNLRVSG